MPDILYISWESLGIEWTSYHQYLVNQSWQAGKSSVNEGFPLGETIEVHGDFSIAMFDYRMAATSEKWGLNRLIMGISGDISPAIYDIWFC